MLQIIRSNRVESLLDQLAYRLRDAPLASAFTPELVVTPSPAMARWVNLGLARELGVAANLQYPLPASFVWGLSAALLEDLPETDPLALDRMAWKIFALLPTLVRESAFAPLLRYLGHDTQGLKRRQLASRIADVFDRYQLYRPELIRRWGHGDEDDWQARLWRQLTAGVERQHRVAVIDRLLETLAGCGPFAELPERVSLFAISSLPPLLVEVIHALAEHTTVEIYIHAPTDAFWADLISQKELARKRLEKPDEADLWEVGNSLLASWGRQGQALQDLLLSHETNLHEVDAFSESLAQRDPADHPPTEPLLARLQRDIFTLRPIAAHEEREAIDPDASVQVHLCHSPLRECQVLHDQLLAMLDADPDLRPEDILVMVPEISGYAPYIEAVFAQDGARERPYLPWNLSDTSIKDEHPLVLIFLQLLALPDSRFCRSEILSYLDVPELAEHFKLDSASVAQIKTWLAEANLCWGLDGNHKRRLDLPAAEENTWAQAEQRLFGGYALGAGDLFDGIAPIGGIEGAKAEVLGRFWRLLSRLADTADRLAAPRTAAAWQTCIGGLLGDFFGERDDEAGRVQRIRDALADLAEQAGELEETLSPPLVRTWLQQRLGAESGHGRYFSGGVTICGMRPMRSLPFKTICILGLHDLAFPRRDRLAEFDLMRKNWRPGDPRKADEDRYLFLETLLCARRCLYLSYVGRDIRKNMERQPSVLVRELLDYIDQQYRITGGEPRHTLSQRLTQVHPLQPFSPRAFTAGRAGYDGYWCDVAQAMQRPVDPTPGNATVESAGWIWTRLPQAPERMREVTLIQLERFVRHPVKHFVNSRLQVYLGEDAPTDDAEPFALVGLPSFGLKQRLVDDHLQGLTPSARRLSAEGALPHGGFAELVFAEQEATVAALIAQLHDYRGQRPGQVAVDLLLDAITDGSDDDPGPRRLSGQIKGIYPDLGLLRWKPSGIKGADILGLWLNHLAWCASADPGVKRSTLYTTGKRFVIHDTLPPEAARAALQDYLNWYWEGVHRPLLVLPKASYAFARTRLEGGRGDPLTAAYSAWNGNSFNQIPGDQDDAYIQLVRRGLAADPLTSEAFAQLAGAFYDKALTCGALR